MENPKISIIMPVYNGEKHMKLSIESILHQTFPDFEFIIINDGSTDNTWEILQEYANQDSRIIPLTQENMGLTISLNRAIDLAQGKYIARQDADDISFPERLKIQWNAAVKGDYDILVSQVAGEGKVYPPTILVKLFSPHLLIYGNKIPHGTFFFKNNSILRYNEEFRYAQDYEFLLRYLLQHQLRFGILNYITYSSQNTPLRVSVLHFEEQKGCAEKACIQYFKRPMKKSKMGLYFSLLRNFFIYKKFYVKND